VSRSVSYVTSLDGWGAEPTEDEQASFCSYVVYRLEQAYPDSEVTAEVDPRALTSVARSDDPMLDCAEVRSYVGNEVWSDWCGGARAPGDVQS